MNRWPHVVPSPPEEGDAQIDGDYAPPANFATAPGQQPWLREQIPPWHMWGTTTEVRIPIQGAAQVRFSQQISRASYKRPDTWHWLFTQRIISGESPPILSYGWSARFNVTVGLGRSAVTLPSFWAFSRQIVSPATLPVGEVLWSTIGIRPPGFTGDPGGTVEELVAQDVQVGVDVALTSAVFPLQDLVFEFGSFWAPKTHIRPDWYNDFPGVPPEKVFGGAETEGR